MQQNASAHKSVTYTSHSRRSSTLGLLRADLAVLCHSPLRTRHRRPAFVKRSVRAEPVCSLRQPFTPRSRPPSYSIDGSCRPRVVTGGSQRGSDFQPSATGAHGWLVAHLFPAPKTLYGAQPPEKTAATRRGAGRASTISAGVATRCSGAISSTPALRSAHSSVHGVATGPARRRSPARLPGCRTGGRLRRAGRHAGPRRRAASRHRRGKPPRPPRYVGAQRGATGGHGVLDPPMLVQRAGYAP